MKVFNSSINNINNMMEAKQSNIIQDRPIVNNISIASDNGKIQLLSKIITNEYLTSDININKKSQYRSDNLVINRVMLNNGSNNMIEIEDIDNGNLPDTLLNALNNYNKGAFKTEAINILDKVRGNDNDGKTTDTSSNYLTVKTKVTPSLFNPYYGVKTFGMHTNLPLLDNVVNTKNDRPTDLSDCSIFKLLELSKNYSSSAVNGLGPAIYRLADFMYCKDLGKVSNNHLITLRRYASPIGDNIFMGNTNDNNEGWGYKAPPDIGRLVTWFGTEDNKLSDICKMSFHGTWKEMNAEIEQVNSKEDEAGRGPLGMVINTFSGGKGEYVEQYTKGATGTHNLFDKIGASIHPALGQGGQNQNEEALGNYDKHKIYTPKNTIQSNNYYEGNLLFEHQFTLTFRYKLCGYSNINSKSAMIELISNILRVTYNEGHFWGGDRKFIGPQQNKSAWNKANKIMHDKWEDLEGFADSALRGNINWQEFLSNLSDAIGNLMNQGKEKVSKFMEDPGGNIADFAKSPTGSIIKNGVKGLLKNAIGRPAMYAMSSLVKGDVLGLWHVTIGNPRNPIMSIGNLIIENTELSFEDAPLGLDDFPSELKVTVTLKHCKPRDMVDIQRMFTKGESTAFIPLSITDIKKLYNEGNKPDDGKSNYYENTFQQMFGTSNKELIEFNRKQLLPGH